MFHTWIASYCQMFAASIRPSSIVTEPSYSRSACVTVARWILDLNRVRRIGTVLLPEARFGAQGRVVGCRRPEPAAVGRPPRQGCAPAPRQIASAPVPSPVAARRLEIFSAARMDPAGFLRFEPGRVRFSLGTSLADFALPVEVAPDAAAIVRAAAAEVAVLLATHHRAFVPADDLDRLILREDYAGLPRVPPRLSAPEGNPDLRAAAQLGPALHPALTGGLVGAWMGKGGRGRSLVALWIGLLGQAFREMAATRGCEETPLVVALALGAATAGAERNVRDALPGSP